MSNFKIKISLILAIFLLISCKNNKNEQVRKTKNNFVKYAKYFNIKKYKNYYKLEIFEPENHKIEKVFILSNKTEKINKNELKIPIKSIICLSGTDIAYLNKLSEINSIKGISNIKYLYNKILINKTLNNEINEWNDIHSISPERVYNKSSFISYSGMGKEIANESKFNKLSITTMPNYDWREEHPLGKAEWIKVYALLFNKIKEGNRIFSELEKNYNILKKNIEEELINKKSKPKILSGSLIGEFWYMPASENYFAHLIKDAGGDYVAKNKKGTGSIALSLEQVYKEFHKSKYWINPMFSTAKEMKRSNKVYTYFEAFTNKNVYCYSHNLNYFWENSSIEPDKMLSDLIQIFHNKKQKKMYFYKKISF